MPWSKLLGQSEHSSTAGDDRGLNRLEGVRNYFLTIWLDDYCNHPKSPFFPLFLPQFVFPLSGTDEHSDNSAGRKRNLDFLY